VLLGAGFGVITARSTVHAALVPGARVLFGGLRLDAARGRVPSPSRWCWSTSGRVMVLFLFVVMMLDINTDAFRQNFWRNFRWPALSGP
jgi:NADH-quinone oxidoreductase subunit J